ncbi:hypothetical protein, partial [uncultured Phocaeicola sp.]|uniref:hypothetical protein n=1 Tax=uncultured Phocaeicola sp. TaxID=990718 RepID=UPI0025A2594E
TSPLRTKRQHYPRFDTTPYAFSKQHLEKWSTPKFTSYCKTNLLSKLKFDNQDSKYLIKKQ